MDEITSTTLILALALNRIYAKLSKIKIKSKMICPNYFSHVPNSTLSHSIFNNYWFSVIYRGDFEMIHKSSIKAGWVEERNPTNSSMLGFASLTQPTIFSHFINSILSHLKRTLLLYLVWIFFFSRLPYNVTK